MDPTLKDQDRLVVNKMIAKEGDTVHIVNGQVRVNDQIIPSPYVAGDHQSYDDWGPEVIPAGYCFVLGDNRSNSSA